jgi:hypothetical protein
MNKIKCGAALCALLAMAGCTSTNLTALPSDDGWRQARVEAVVQDTRAWPAHAMACQGELIHASAARHLAVLSYSYGGSPTLRAMRLALVQDKDDVAVGDRVQVHLGHCSDAVQRNNR